MTNNEVLDTLSIGDSVIHSNHEDWGVAKVVSITSTGNTVYILFSKPNAGSYNINTYGASNIYLTKVSYDTDILILMI